MLNNEAICYGCCIDYQGVANAADFEDHPFRELFNDIASLTGKNASELRTICLQHQIEILGKDAQD